MSFVYRPTLANLNLGAPLALVFSARNMLKKKIKCIPCIPILCVAIGAQLDIII